MNVFRSVTGSAVIAFCATGILAAGPLTFSPEMHSGGQKAPLQLRDGNIIAARPEASRSGTGVCVRCYRSADMGSTWQASAIIAEDANPRTDIGDGHLVMLADGRVLYSHRHNRFAGLPMAERSFPVRASCATERSRRSCSFSTTGTRATTAAWAASRIEPERFSWLWSLLQAADP